MSAETEVVADLDEGWAEIAPLLRALHEHHEPLVAGGCSRIGKRDTADSSRRRRPRVRRLCYSRESRDVRSVLRMARSGVTRPWSRKHSALSTTCMSFPSSEGPASPGCSLNPRSVVPRTGCRRGTALGSGSEHECRRGLARAGVWAAGVSDAESAGL